MGEQANKSQATRTSAIDAPSLLSPLSSDGPPDPESERSARARAAPRREAGWSASIESARSSSRTPTVAVKLAVMASMESALGPKVF